MGYSVNNRNGSYSFTTPGGVTYNVIINNNTSELSIVNITTNNIYSKNKSEIFGVISTINSIIYNDVSNKNYFIIIKLDEKSRRVRLVNLLKRWLDKSYEYKIVINPSINLQGRNPMNTILNFSKIIITDKIVDNTKKFCTNCGSENKDYKFCPNCGANLQ